MPDQKLSQLPAGAAVLPTDLFYSDQQGNSVSQPASALATFVQSVTPPLPSAVIYYISAAGSDSNNGTSPATPWATIAKVNSIIPNPGTSFLFRGGDTFTGALILAASGQPGAPISYDSYEDGKATISSGNGSGIAITNLDNVAIQNLNFVGAGISGTNVNYGVFVNNTTRDCANYLINNLTVSQYNGQGIGLACGNANPATPFFTRNIAIKNCTVHDCAQNAIQLSPLNQQATGTNQALFFCSFVNVLIDHCHLYNIPGQNTVPQQFGGSGIVAQGVDGCVVQYCLVHDNGFNPSVNSGPAIYTANCNNGLFQYNEVYNQATNDKDGAGIQADFGVTNVTIQYNYLHDIASSAIRSGTLGASFASNNVNTTIRYNICIANGSLTGASTWPGGIDIYTLGATDQLFNMLIYNNTIIGGNQNLAGSSSALITDNNGHSGNCENVVIANNVFVADANTQILSYVGPGGQKPSWKFIGNVYGGGALTGAVKTVLTGNASVPTWIAASITNGDSQECIDGAQVNTSALLTADPLLVGALNANSSLQLAMQPLYPRTSPNTNLGAVGGGTGTLSFLPVGGTVSNQGDLSNSNLFNPGRASYCQLSPMSPSAKLGVDLTAILPMQLNAPMNQGLAINGAPAGVTQGGVDWNFKGGNYVGGVIGDVTCSRTSAAATDLLYSSPIAATITNFAANTLRITPGKGLLIEEARTQFAPTPVAPAPGTQTTASIPNGTNLSLWINGPGSATVAGGTGTISTSQGFVAVHGKPIGFAMTSTGTVTITIAGTVYALQLENSPNGNPPTSFINATGTRDADVVTTTTGTTIGGFLNGVLNGGNGQGTPPALCVFTNHPTPTGIFSFLTIATDNSNVGAVGLGVPTTNGLQAQQKLSGNNLATATVPSRLGRHISVFYNVNGVAQTTILDGGVPQTSSLSVTPATTSPIHIGNRSAGDVALNGYIERITSPSIVFNPIPISQLQAVSSLTPLITDFPKQDFFGNPVPYNGRYSPGAHQSLTVGNTVTLNGATPVAVTDLNVTPNSIIHFSLKTAHTPGAYPNLTAVTPGSGFSVVGTAGDVSVYNYVILG